MHTVETDWWVLDLPDEWQAEEDEGTVVIGDEDGVGAIEITALEADDVARNEAGFQQLAEQLLDIEQKGEKVAIGALRGLYFHYVDGDDAVREWLLDADDVVLLISYSCDCDNAGMDDGVVDEILSTLELKPLSEE
jgi:hypothetical protein